MSVTFWNQADENDELNMSNTNAGDVMEFIGMPPEEWCGRISARDLAVLCGRALIRLAGTEDEARPVKVERAPRKPTVITCERLAGYRLGRAAELREMAIRAGDGVICWG